MNNKKAKDIVKKHIAVLKDHKPMHGMTDMEMEILAEQHAIKEVEGIIDVLHNGNKTKRVFYRSILTELKSL